MTAEAFTAWVLHKRPSGDTSVRTTFFTREKGVVDCLCKGGRTPKKQAILQPFTPLWLSIDRRKDWYFARHVETVGSFCELKSQPLFAGLYLNELLYYTLTPLDPQPALFDVYVHTMDALTTISDRSAIEILLRRFESALLAACGHSISFDEESSARPIEPQSYYQFIAGEGFKAVAGKGIAGSDILAIAQGKLDDFQVLKAAKFIMRQAIDFLLDGRELKSRTFARSMALMERENLYS